MQIDRPVIFSGPMVRALLREAAASGAGKTMTRRIAKPQPKPFLIEDKFCDVTLMHVEGNPWPCVTLGRVITKQEVRYKPGLKLWVRENWKPHSIYAEIKPRLIPQSKVFYAADEAYAPSNTPWRPSIFMPRWASRLTLDVTAVKIERLQDISEHDAKAEGCEPAIAGQNEKGQIKSHRTGFVRLWNSLHDIWTWGINPYVVAISFKVHLANIDAMREAA